MFSLPFFEMMNDQPNAVDLQSITEGDINK